MVATELAPGVVIGARYRLERLLGEGGMGAVWSAEDTATGQRCALKLMKDPAGDPEAHQRFLREGRAASAVHHPNVVGILDATARQLATSPLSVAIGAPHPVHPGPTQARGGPHGRRESQRSAPRPWIR